MSISDPENNDKSSLFDFLQDDDSRTEQNAPRRQSRGESPMPIIRKPVPVEQSAREDAERGGDEFGFLDDSDASASNDLPQKEVWSESLQRTPVFDEDEPSTRKWIWVIPVVAILLGAVYFSGYFGDPPDESDTAVISPTVEQSATDTTLEQTELVDVALPEQQRLPASLSQRFATAISDLDSMLIEKRFDDADAYLEAMDRTLFGYGQPEFTEFKARIQQGRLGELDTRVEVEETATRLKVEGQAEQARLQQEQALARQNQEEQDRKLAEELAAQAAIREQAEQARQAELLKQEQLAKQAEIAKQAQIANEAALKQQEEIAQQAEATRQAEIAAQAEATRQAEIAAQAEATRQAEIAAQAEATRLAEIAAQAAATRRAELAAQARAARQQARLKREQELDEARQAQRLAAQSQATEESASRDGLVIQPSNPATISDADFQRVHGKFSELRLAIEARDIGAVTALTSGASASRVQQLLQLFQNADLIDSRITKLAAKRADGAIIGTLEIINAQRDNGTSVRVPDTLRSLKISSRRTSAGWSVIDW